MTVCYFGIYDPLYARNKNNIVGLKENGVAVIEMQDRARGFGKYYRLAKKLLTCQQDVDFIIIGFPGQIIVPLVKIACRKPVVLDLFVSYFDSIILERKKHSLMSLYAVWYYFLDWLSCQLADVVLMDTAAHCDYVSSLLRIRREKFIPCYVGIDETVFKPAFSSIPRTGKKFMVSFHGNIQILNGMDLVIRAMKQLERENIELWIIGGGPEYGTIKKLAQDIKASNIMFLGSMRPQELVQKVVQTDLGIGFFSTSKKIDRVIANKVYELIAMKVPVLTGHSAAMAELFKHKEHVYYCNRGSVEAITEALLQLRDDAPLRRGMADNAYAYAHEHLTPKVVMGSLIEYFEKIRL